MTQKSRNGRELLRDFCSVFLTVQGSDLFGVDAVVDKLRHYFCAKFRQHGFCFGGQRDLHGFVVERLHAENKGPGAMPGQLAGHQRIHKVGLVH